MFIKNFDSIKRPTILVGNSLKHYLQQHGHSPISKNKDKWIYIETQEILSLINKYKGGDT